MSHPSSSAARTRRRLRSARSTRWASWRALRVPVIAVASDVLDKDILDHFRSQDQQAKQVAARRLATANDHAKPNA